MEPTKTRAGHLIRAGAVGTCLRTWHRLGRKGRAWEAVRRELRELFPTARSNSLAAVVRVAQGAAAVARYQAKHGPDALPPDGLIPDARRLIRDAHRE